MAARLGYPVYDADNPLYEPQEALVGHLPRRFKKDVQYVQVNGRTKLALCGQISDYIPNPTFDVVAPPGVHEKWYRGQNSEGLSMRELSGTPEKCRDAYRAPEPRLRLMDEQGLAATLMFPTLASAIEERMSHDHELVHAVIHSLNEWILEVWGFVHRGRIFSTPIVTLMDDATIPNHRGSFQVDDEGVAGQRTHAETAHQQARRTGKAPAEAHHWGAGRLRAAALGHNPRMPRASSKPPVSDTSSDAAAPPDDGAAPADKQSSIESIAYDIPPAKVEGDPEGDLLVVGINGDASVRGLKGPVGTQLDLRTLFAGDARQVARLERSVAAQLGFAGSLEAVGQVYPRSLDFAVVGLLYQLAAGAEQLRQEWKGFTKGIDRLLQ